MIKTPTVLILGAGASCGEPYRFPTGKGLCRDIIDLATSDNNTRNEHFVKLGLDLKELSAFGKDFEASRPTSIVTITITTPTQAGL